MIDSCLTWIHTIVLTRRNTEMNMTDYNCVRHILLRLRNEWSHNPKLLGVSIKFSVSLDPSSSGRRYTPGLVRGHWNFWRRENSAWWIGIFWKTTMDSPRSEPIESVEDNGSKIWPIDAHTLVLYETRWY